MAKNYQVPRFNFPIFQEMEFLDSIPYAAVVHGQDATFYIPGKVVTN